MFLFLLIRYSFTKMTNNKFDQMRFCVIGAGASGICAARRLLEAASRSGQSETIEIRVFEQTDQLGGTWVLDESEEAHSSMYANLRTNLPRELMHFDNCPFEASFPGESSYPTADKVLAYLQQFARPIHHLIQFNTRVISVKHVPEAVHQWAVTVQQQQQKGASAEQQMVVEHFDVLFVCAGHDSKPRLPSFVDKLNTSKLPWLHSHSYRYAEHYKGKTVALVGGSLSGTDIALQLVDHAKKIYLLHRRAPQRSSDCQPKGSSNGHCPTAGRSTSNRQKSLCKDDVPHDNDSPSDEMDKEMDKEDDANGSPCFWSAEERPPNCEELCRVVDCTESGLILADGTELGLADGLDLVIFCTGYRFSFPFLEAGGVVTCPGDEAFVTPLWAHFIHPLHCRSLFIVCLLVPVIPFQLIDAQVHLALAILQDRAQLPSVEKMLAESEQRIDFLTSCRLPLKYFHRLDTFEQFLDHIEWLDKLAGRPNWRPPVHKAIFHHFRATRARIRTNKDRNVHYVIKNDEEFEAIELEEEDKASRMMEESQKNYNQLIN